MSRITKFTVLAGVLVSANVAQAALVAHWTADGNFLDSSGNGHDGIAYGDTGFTTGVFGQAFTFDGDGDYITVNDHDDFNFGTGDLSVSFWVKYDTLLANGNGIIDKDNFSESSTTDYNGWLFNTNTSAGGTGMEVRDIPDTGGSNTRTAGLTQDSWHHIVGVRDTSLGSLLLYLDGTQLSPVSYGTAVDVNNDINLIIGALAPSGVGAQFLNGSLDDIAIFNHALTASEVQGIGANGVSPVPIPAAAWLFASALGVFGYLGKRKAAA